MKWQPSPILSFHSLPFYHYWLLNLFLSLLASSFYHRWNPLFLFLNLSLSLLSLWLTVLIMCARIPISLDTCKGLCPLFHYTQTHLQWNVHAHTQTDGEKEGELGFLSNPQTLTQILTDLHLQMLPNILSLTRGGTNALETNYQSGVSLYSYLGQ